jgi:hypothetical protein
VKFRSVATKSVRGSRRASEQFEFSWKTATTSLSWYLGETGPLSQGVQARRKALRIRHINGMEVRKKRPRGFKKKSSGFKFKPA